MLCIFLILIFFILRCHSDNTYFIIAKTYKFFFFRRFDYLSYASKLVNKHPIICWTNSIDKINGGRVHKSITISLSIPHGGEKVLIVLKGAVSSHYPIHRNKTALLHEVNQILYLNIINFFFFTFQKVQLKKEMDKRVVKYIHII